MKIAFLHPDLGIGGAERLVVDAALGLQLKGYEVEFFTSHHSKTHCYTETKDGTLKVNTYGDWLPRTIFGKCHLICALLRAIYLTLVIALLNWKGSKKYDLYFTDQIALYNPLLRLFSKTPIIFYCHFPDLLLSTNRKSVWKRIYRYPLDWVEEFSTKKAHLVLVNSKFTLKTFHSTFKSIKKSPRVLRPGINLDLKKSWEKRLEEGEDEKEIGLEIPSDVPVVLSINRFERKKGIDLALKALSKLNNQQEKETENENENENEKEKKNENETENQQEKEKEKEKEKENENENEKKSENQQEKKKEEISLKKTILIIAGGYDKRVVENVEHYEELKQLAEKLNIQDQTIFVRSFTEQQASYLLWRASCLVYTPINEHFGIVPVEAMWAGCPVVATNTGGPLESVKNGITGFLSEPNENEFGSSIKKILTNKELQKKMGLEGKERVQRKFSLNAFSENLDNYVKETIQAHIKIKKVKKKDN
ncbi:alpha-13/16-mannosyltransferase alg2 [Anaeramoeba flamelloides]|uniref:Alpha-1,3/1,6-mannosyltransferase ALG2 n=1 Tax=Anaeramoeba flamelloides TaxID=1746091 RepID=A0AAV7YU68_9EUKA|nr:alpha-13/16-mannosyltransferase alg2 [Anaeramoeba flamelloides]